MKVSGDIGATGVPGAEIVDGVAGFPGVRGPFIMTGDTTSELLWEGEDIGVVEFGDIGSESLSALLSFASFPFPFLCLLFFTLSNRFFFSSSPENIKF